MSDRTEVSLKKLTARRQIEAFERVCQQLEIRVLNRQTRGRRGAGAGHIRYRPNLCLSPRVGESELSFLHFVVATKSPLVLDPAKPSWDSYHPKRGGILLQNKGFMVPESEGQEDGSRECNKSTQSMGGGRANKLPQTATKEDGETLVQKDEADRPTLGGGPWRQ